jgi:TolA-binding protein
MSVSTHHRLRTLAPWLAAMVGFGAPAARADEGDPEAERVAKARARVESVPEIGRCHREPLETAGQGGQPSVNAADDPLAAHRADFEAAVLRYEAVAQDYRDEIDRMLEDRFRERIGNVDKRYDREVERIEVLEKQRRLEAIAQFERFIERYPTDPRHTPDAMFRLAELYYERSAVDYDEATVRYNEQRKAFEAGTLKERPVSPERSYADCVRVYETLLSRFGSNYRYADAVMYLLGYVLQESFEELKAREVWRELVQKYPKSEYAPEVWLRVGEIHFDEGEFEKAAEAYSGALAYTDSRFYDKALYKLGWTYFQLFDYDRAIKTFKQLIAWYDTNAATLGEATASALRDEAIEYLAKSLTEDDWDADGVEDPNRGIERALGYLTGGQKFERDIMIRYADALYDLHDQMKYREAIEVYRRVIAGKPTALDAVDLQQKIIQILDILRDVDGSTLERKRLAEMFAPNSPWALANASDAKRVAEARETIELEMRRRALTLHQRAQELKTEAKEADDPAPLLAQSFEHYVSASRAYREYLTRYPTEPASYEMRFYLAETLYYSDQIDEAATVYLEVASDPYQARFREMAAWSAIKANERIIGDAVKKSRIPEKSNPNAAWDPPPLPEEAGSEKRLVNAEPYPPEVERWRSAIDFYLLRDIKRDGSRKPQVAFAYQGGVMAMRFHSFEEARTRFKQVIACFPEEPLAADAMANILNSYRDENDLQSLEQWAGIAEKLELGDPDMTAQIRSKIKVFKLGAQFQRAEALLAEGKKLEAAREFERLADQNQDAAFLDKAYYNAAMAYKDVKYYDSAARIFEKLVNEPRFAKSEFKTESVFELAENYKLFFAFEKAVDTYNLFLQRTEGTNNPNRPYALFTAARLQEYAGNLAEAAKTYERYATVFKDRDDSANAIYRASELHGRLKVVDQQKRMLTLFVERFKNKQAMGTQVLGAMLELGDIAFAQNRTKEALKIYADVLREYKARGFQPGTQAAMYAAKALFLQIDQRFLEYEKIRLTGTSQRKMAVDLAQKKKLMDELELAFAEVFGFKSLDWTIAAYFRLGDLHREFAKTLYAAPEPQGLSDEELEEYVTQIEDLGLSYENVAIERFEKTVQESRRLKVTNDWAMKALAAINQYKPQEYPLFKDTLRLPTFRPRFRADARVRPAAAAPAPAPKPVTPDAGEGLEEQLK